MAKMLYLTSVPQCGKRDLRKAKHINQHKDDMIFQMPRYTYYSTVYFVIGFSVQIVHFPL